MTELLSPRDLALVDAVALRVLELLDERAAAIPTGLVDAQTIAGLLGLSRATVYEHASELGGVRVGDGPRPRLRFDVDQARQAWSARDTSGRSLKPDPPAAAPVRRPRRLKAARPDAQLLPIRPPTGSRAR